MPTALSSRKQCVAFIESIGSNGGLKEITLVTHKRIKRKTYDKFKTMPPPASITLTMDSRLGAITMALIFWNAPVPPRATSFRQ